ncbi:MAG: hypothetical protein JWM20_13 [Patescibacteria group bacterium]|nr:hypothetical protein [Patescibacteria group bacterium]
MQNINAWAENLQKEVYEKFQNNYKFWKPGIKIFYSPVIENPELMIISYQPGGGEENFNQEDKIPFEKGDFSLRKFNSYSVDDYAMSRKMKDFFDFEKGSEMLEKSVVTPLIFFRASSVNFWKKENTKADRLEIEKFCFEKTKKIIERLKPKKILVLGIDTYKNLKKYVLDPITQEQIIFAQKNSNARMVLTAKYGNSKVFAISHPTGSRISKEDWNSMKNLFLNF